MPLHDSTKATIPNALTIARLFLAAAFFVVLSVSVADWAIITAIGLFIVAAVTDAADGYLARRWKVESTFGRIADPFADKVLVLGALVMLAGPGFSNLVAELPYRDDHAVLVGVTGYYMTTGVQPWMVVVILARELLVTAIRGVVESTGHKFGANWWGKAKMILQSVVVPVCLLCVLLGRRGDAGMYATIATGLMLLTVLVTVVSGLPYVTGARRVLRGNTGQ